MHHSFQALGNCARLAGCDLSEVNWKHVHDDALERREAHFLNQRSWEMQRSVHLTSAIMRGMKEGMELVEIEGLVDKTVRDKIGWRLPKNMDVEDFHNHLVHRGVLQQRLDQTFNCPIPSFRTYLIERANDVGLWTEADTRNHDRTEADDSRP